MASKKPAKKTAKKTTKAKAKNKKPSSAKWAKNAKEAAAKAKENAGKKIVAEDGHTIGRRIRDLGQKPPKGYMRTGGRYFAKIENMRPIRSMTTQQQRNMFYANIDKYLGARRDGGYLGSAANQGMYNGETSEANFRKTVGARKLADSHKVYPQFGTAGAKKGKSKSRYIMAIGQDGHVR